MEAFVRGDIVVTSYPYSAEERWKRRPALVISSWEVLGSRDYLIALITTRSIPEGPSVRIESSDISGGSLSKTSFVRPSYLATVDSALIRYKVGSLRSDLVSSVIDSIRTLLD